MKPSFWRDFKKSFSMLNVAFYFAWSDLRARYKRSFLGPFWIVLTTAISILGLGVVWGVVMNESLKTLLPSLTLGLIFWSFIAGCITEAPKIFLENASAIKGYPNPYLFFILRHVIKHSLLLAHNLLIVILVCLIFHVFQTSFDYVMFGFGFCLLVANLFWMSTLLALINVRYRDLELIVSSIMPLIFFLTPVIFRPQQIASIQRFMYLNPFANLLRVVRDPLYSGFSNYNILLTNLGMLIGGLLLTTVIYRNMIREVPYLV